MVFDCKPWLILPKLGELTVGSGLNLVGQFADVDFEAGLHIVQHLGILFVGHESDGKTLGTESTSTGDLRKHSKIAAGQAWHVRTR